MFPAFNHRREIASMRAMRVLCLLFLTLGIAHLPLASTNAPIEDEREIGELIAQVRIAATNKNLASLADLMSEDFRYSLGGNRSRREALEYFQDHPEILDELALALKETCTPVDYGSDRYVICPAVAVEAESTYLGERAGFLLGKDGRWAFVFSLRGD